MRACSRSAKSGLPGFVGIDSAINLRDRYSFRTAALESQLPEHVFGNRVGETPRRRTKRAHRPGTRHGDPVLGEIGSNSLFESARARGCTGW